MTKNTHSAERWSSSPQLHSRTAHSFVYSFSCPAMHFTNVTFSVCIEWRGMERRKWNSFFNFFYFSFYSFSMIKVFVCVCVYLCGWIWYWSSRVGKTLEKIGRWIIYNTSWERMRNETWYHYTKVHVCIVYIADVCITGSFSHVLPWNSFLHVKMNIHAESEWERVSQQIRRGREWEWNNNKTDDREHVKWLGVNSFGRYI